MTQTILKGTIYLFLAALFNRVIGFAYRMLVVRLVGAEGIGLYEMVFPVYTLVLVLTTAGVPVAVAKLVAEKLALGSMSGAQKVFRLGRNLLALTGLVFTLAFFFLAPYITKWYFLDARVYPLLLVMAPAIVIVSVSSAYRGYFQGRQWMHATALAQVLEQIVRIIAGLYLVYHLLPRGLEYAVAGLAGAMLTGEAAGFLFLVCLNRYQERRRPVTNSQDTSFPNLWHEINRLSLPVTLTRVSTSLLISIEAYMIPHRLQIAGYSISRSTELYGQFSGMAFSLLGLPTILTVSLATSLVPAIAEAMALRHRGLVSYRSNLALRLTVLTGLPFTAAFFLFPRELTTLFFSNAEAGLSLKVLALSAVFFYLLQTTSGILQGLGRVRIAFLNSLYGNLVNLAGLYYLTAVPAYGIQGASLAAALGGIVNAWLNCKSISKHVDLDANWPVLLLKSGLATLALSLMASLTFSYMQNSGQTLFISLSAALCLGFATYLLLLICSGTVTREDWQRLPFLRRVRK